MSVLPHRSVPLLDALVTILLDPPRRSVPTPDVGYGATFDDQSILVLDEFLVRPELDDLVGWVTAHEQDFGISNVISSSGRDGVLDAGHRRSKVLLAPGPFRMMFQDRLMSVLDHVCWRVGLPALPVSEIEIQITASNDGEFFRAHTDNGHRVLTGRKLTYVYFFHREPAAFSGGRLRFFEQTEVGGRILPGRLLAEVVPRQNQVVFFPSHYFHEIETVSCPSRRFVDSRFTVNGWYRTQ